MKLIREIQTSERLPEEQKQYMTEYGWCTYHPLLKEWRQSDGLQDYKNLTVSWWLESIEITEERDEIEKDADLMWGSLGFGFVQDKESYEAGYYAGAMAIISKLKGE